MTVYIKTVLLGKESSPVKTTTMLNLVKR